MFCFVLTKLLSPQCWQKEREQQLLCAIFNAKIAPTQPPGLKTGASIQVLSNGFQLLAGATVWVAKKALACLH